jgi:hypothetical protein
MSGYIYNHEFSRSFRGGRKFDASSFDASSEPGFTPAPMELGWDDLVFGNQTACTKCLPACRLGEEDFLCSTGEIFELSARHTTLLKTLPGYSRMILVLPSKTLTELKTQ